MMGKKISYTDHTNEVFNSYCNDIRKYVVLSTSEELQLAKEALRGDEKARNAIIEANLRYVITLAKGYQVNDNILNDLIEAGNEGLIEALNSFDPTRGNRFCTYAEAYIMEGMRRFLNEYRLIRIPDGVYRAIRNGECQENEYIYIDAPISDDSEETWGDFYLADESNSNFSDHESEMDYLQARIGSLPAKQAKAVNMSYGFEDGFEHSLESIADALHVSPERARQILAAGEKNLKTHLATA